MSHRRRFLSKWGTASGRTSSNGLQGGYAISFTMHDLVHDLARATLSDKVNQNGIAGGSSYQYALLTYRRGPLSSPENIKQDTWQDPDIMYDLEHVLARTADKVNKYGNVVGRSYQYALVTDPSKPLSCPEDIKVLHLNCDHRELANDAFPPAKNLLVLDISNCINQMLPNSIGNLKQLRYLCAPMIPDRRIPMCISELSKLNYLNLCGSHMEALPDAVGDMKDLMYLNLSYCLNLSKLPVSFVDLKKLVFLDLSKCPVPISESWGGLTNLQYLNLSQHWFSQSFEVLPEAIGKLTKLQYLNISFFIKFGQTKVLPVIEVFHKLTKLRYLNLAGCMSMTPEPDIYILLDGISALHNLEHLDLSCSERLNSIPQSIGNLTKLHTLDLLGCIIQKLPTCIAKMASLKIVNMETLDECGSSLILIAAANSLELNISKLEDVKSLEEAQRIELIEKKRLNDLKLKWTVDCDRRFFDDKDVLEVLVPPNTITSLNISGYSSTSFPTNWLMAIGKYLPNVMKITLEDFPMCNNLPPLGQLPNLKYLGLHRLVSLEELNTADSSGDLMFPMLDTLNIMSCPKLRLKPCLPSALSSLSLHANDNMLTSWGQCVSETSCSFSSSLLANLTVERSTVPLCRWRLLHHVSALRTLIVRDCSDLASCSPEVIECLSSLESLELKDDILTELPTWLLELTSLQQLTIRLPKLEKLNDSTRQLTRLQDLCLVECRTMASLPQWLGELTSLKELKIIECKGIRSLPGSIRQLNKLSLISIEKYVMCHSEIEKMFSSISADTDEVNIREGREYYQEELGKFFRSMHTPTIAKRPEGSDSIIDEEGIEEDKEDIEEELTLENIEEHAEEDRDEFTEKPTGEHIEEHKEDINQNLTSVDSAAVLVRSPSAISIESGSAARNLSDMPADAHIGQVGVRNTWTFKSLLLWLVPSVPCLGKLGPCMGLESS